jgi:polar amino acid transport system substrate-binding protein
VKLVGFKSEGFYHFNTTAKKQITLATLDWPPYISEQLCDRGWVFQLAVSLFHAAGYGVKVQFLPWARAVRKVEQGEYDVLFPEYYIEERAPSDNFTNTKRRDLLELSQPFPGGNISFVKLKGTQDNFAGQLNNMLGQDIGVVRGYQNTPEFDAMMDSGKFNIVEAVDDIQQVRLLFAKRVKFIIGDPMVIESVVKLAPDISSTQKHQMLKNLEEVKPEIQYNPLYFAVSKRKPNWQTTLNDINEEITHFEQYKEFEFLIKHSKQVCSK